jgi:hypothetical protein
MTQFAKNRTWIARILLICADFLIFCGAPCSDFSGTVFCIFLDEGLMAGKISQPRAPGCRCHPENRDGTYIALFSHAENALYKENPVICKVCRVEKYLRLADF